MLQCPTLLLAHNVWPLSSIHTPKPIGVSNDWPILRKVQRRDPPYPAVVRPLIQKDYFFCRPSAFRINGIMMLHRGRAGYQRNMVNFASLGGQQMAGTSRGR